MQTLGTLGPMVVRGVFWEGVLDCLSCLFFHSCLFFYSHGFFHLFLFFPRLLFFSAATIAGWIALEAMKL